VTSVTRWCLEALLGLRQHSIFPRVRHDHTTENERAGQSMSPQMLATMNAYWRAANYLSVGQITSKTTSLERPLTLDT